MKKTKIQKEIIAWAVECCKEIDDNPFIAKKVDWMWRFAAWRAGIKNPKSQADYMKETIKTRAKTMLLELENSVAN